MTVSSTTTKAGPYAGAGTAGPFAVAFRFLEDSHLRVVRTDAEGVDTVLALGADYGVTGAGDSVGAVTLTAPLPVAHRLTILRSVPATQEADYVQNDAFPAESHERALDKLTMLAQETAEKLARAIVLPASDSASRGTTLPSEANRAGKALVFDASGGVSVSVDNYNDQLANVSEQARIAAEQAGISTDQARGAALSAQAAAAAAAASHGGIKLYPTRAEAAVAATELPDGADVEVSQDETRAGARTRYKVLGSVLVFAVNLDQTRLDLANASDPAKGAALAGYLLPESGAVGSTVQAKLGSDLKTATDWGHVISPVTPYPYPEDLPLEVLQGVNGEQVSVALAKTLAFTDTPAFKLNARAGAAFRKGSVRVTIVGDSITAGADNWGPNSYTSLLSTQLKQTFPWVTFNFQNLAIGGMSAGVLIADSYRGANSLEDLVVGSNFWFPPNGGGVNNNPVVAPVGHTLLNDDTWPMGSTPGKSWRQHVLDSNPDIIVWAFGMNDGINYDGFLNNYELFQSFVAANIVGAMPWFTLVSCFLPDKVPPAGQPHAEWQTAAQCIADQVKYLAKRDNYGLIDANSVFNLLRDGIRHDYPVYAYEGNWRFAGDTTKWTFPGGFSLSGNTATGTGLAVRAIKARDIDASFNFRLGAFTGGAFVPRIQYRTEPGVAGSGYSADAVFLHGSPTLTVLLYYRSTVIAFKEFDQGAVAGVGHITALKVKCYGDRHEVWVGGNKLIDTTDQRSLFAGTLSIGVAQGSGDVYFPGIAYGNTWDAPDMPTTVDRKMLLGTPIYDAGGNFVTYGDFITNPDSLGGNVVNHPTAWGHNTYYGLGVARFVAELKQQVSTRLKHVEQSSASFVVSSDAPQLVPLTPPVVLACSATTRVVVTIMFAYSNTSTTCSPQVGYFLNGTWAGSSYVPPSGTFGMQTLVFSTTLPKGVHKVELGAVRAAATDVFTIGRVGTTSTLSVEAVGF